MSVYVKQNQIPYFICVFVVCVSECVCVSVFVRLSLGLLLDLDSNVLSFCLSTSLMLPYATVWHFNRLFLSSSVSF